MSIENTGRLSAAHEQKKLAATIANNSRALSKVLEKLSSANRIAKAADDAAGLAVSEQLIAQSRGFKAASQNVSDAMSALSIADGATQEIQNMVQRQRELAVQASNDTLNNDQRRQLNVEYQNLTNEIDRVAQATNFNRQTVLNGQNLGSGNAQIQTGANQGESSALPKISLRAQDLNITNTSIATSSAAQNAISSLDSSLQTLSTQRSSIGSMVNRLESNQNNLMVAQINTEAAESVIKDQDMAMGLAELTRQKLLNESQMQAFSRFNQIATNQILGLTR